MSKSKINNKEFSQDLNKIFEIVSKLNDKNLSLKEISKLSKKIKILDKQIKNKYKNLDSKK